MSVSNGLTPLFSDTTTHSSYAGSLLSVYFYRSILPIRIDSFPPSALQVAMRAVPHREDFYNRLTEGTPHEKFDAELSKWLDGLEGIVNRMRTFLESGGYGKV